MLNTIAFGTLLGMTALHFYPEWPPSPLLQIALIVFLLGCIFIVWKIQARLLYKISIVMLTFLFGWGWAYYHVTQRLKYYDVRWIPSRQLMTIQGIITGVVENTGKKCKMDCRLADIPFWKIRLFMPSSGKCFREGDRIMAQITLSPVWGMANPGGKDQQKILFTEGILAVGQVKKIIAHHPDSHFSLSSWRQRISDQIGDKLKHQPLFGVIQAMTVGVRGNITREEWKIFQETGTSHVVAISGLHVGLVSLLVAKAGGAWVRRSYTLTSIAPVQSYQAVLAILGALFYSAAAGFSVSTKRACIMIIIFMIFRLFRQRILSWHTLALAWLVIAVMDPFAPLQIGFWLSFICVAILIMSRACYDHRHRFQRWIVPQGILFVGLIPVNLFFFQQISLLSIPANLFFLPIVSIVIVPASLLGSMGLPMGLAIAHQALHLSWVVLKKISLFKWGIISVSLFTAPDRPSEGAFRFTLLDVGQGLASVIQTKSHTLIYDTGPAYYSGGDVGEQIIVPFLKAQGIRKIDKIVVSHTDLDHRGGLAGLVLFPHGAIFTSEPKRLSFPAQACVAGERWIWDGVEFVFLSPSGFYKKRNNLSCVLKVKNAYGKSLLLTGDIEIPAEKRLLGEVKDQLKSDVLVIPHHGSLSSSSVDFIEAVAPTYALIAAGRDNRYHFPREEIMKRYEVRGIHRLLTWQTGAIIFEFSQEDPLTPPICWRDTFQHYWNKTAEIRRST